MLNLCEGVGNLNDHSKLEEVTFEFYGGLHIVFLGVLRPVSTSRSHHYDDTHNQFRFDYPQYDEFGVREKFGRDQQYFFSICYLCVRVSADNNKVR